MVFSRAINSIKNILEIRKEKKREKSLGLKKFVSSGLFFKRHTNWMSNSERHTG
jgi:hypothetical protein